MSYLQKKRWPAKPCYLVFALLLVLANSGCASFGVFPQATGTQVELSRKNFEVVRSNAIGQSSGFALFGVIPIVSATYTDAMSDLYAKTGGAEGEAQALINVTQERSARYWILFSLYTLTVRADIIEFTGD
ncbi:MAG TPA: hypothetical protein PLG17_12420 [Thermodesulfobacteriota bacterium]|nr:hypothetical protein [Thermodesulfobacteriota bacterium]HQO79302.1 hypothetical protein [Thermodesulfobacteriota bacterium]